jgi:hypothetical protein
LPRAAAESQALGKRMWLLIGSAGLVIAFGASVTSWEISETRP